METSLINEEKIKNLIKENEQLSKDLQELKNKLQEQITRSETMESKYQKAKEIILKKDSLIIRLENLSAVGQFIPEIIHKLKNPLMGISGYAELAELANTKEAMLVQIEKIQPQVSKISTLLGQFRSMISSEASEIKKFDLNLNLTETLMILDLIKPKIFELKSSYDKNVLSVLADPIQIQQIHLNIAKIIFKNIAHDQNRLIETTTQAVSVEHWPTLGFSGLIQCQNELQWNTFLKNKLGLAIIQYQCDLLNISNDDIRLIFAEKYQNCSIDSSKFICFQIIFDIVKRHQGNFFIMSSNGKTTFYLALPLQ